MFQRTLKAGVSRRLTASATVGTTFAPMKPFCLDGGSSSQTAISVRYAATSPPGGRRTFQPFSKADEDELLKVITTKPRHVLKHVRQLVWRSRKRELHFRNTVTQVMVTLQDFLRKQLIEPEAASAIMEGVMYECVKLQQHDMAHLLFRAFLRFRKFGCTITLSALRALFDSYKGTENKEMMSQLATEMSADPNLPAFCIAAHLFAGNLDEANVIKSRIQSGSELGPTDMAAIVEGYDVLKMDDEILEFIEECAKLKGLVGGEKETTDEKPSAGESEEKVSEASATSSSSDLLPMFQSALKAFYKKFDHRRFNRALELMEQTKTKADGATFGTILRMKLQDSSTLDEIHAVEAQVKRMGYQPDIAGNSIIIAAYARMNHLGDRSSEEIMLNKVDTLLSSIETRLAQGDADLDVSGQHIRAVIRGYGAAGRPELMKTAWDKLRHDAISNDTRVYNELLKWYSLMGNVKDVLATKDEMKEKDVSPDAATYNWIFKALGKYYPNQAEKLYEELRALKVRPDLHLYLSLISVFGDLGNFDRCEKLAAEIRKREEAGTVPVSPFTYTQLIRVFSHDLSKVESFYKEAKEKNVADHSHVLTTLMAAYAKSPGGDVKLEAMLANVPHWTVDIYNCLLSLYGRQNDKEKVDALVERMEREGIEYNEVTFGTLVTSYGKWKNVEKLHSLIEALKNKEGQVSANFYSILAATYSKLGDTEAIADAWEDLQSSKLFPDTTVYNQFLSLHGRHSNVNEMQSVLDNMLKMVPPNPLTATTVVDMLGKSGRIQDMEALIEDMSQSEDTAPTIVTYHQAMNAYGKTGDVIKMERQYEQLKMKGFTENHVTYNILVDGYGRAKRFEAIQDLLNKRAEQGIPMDELGYCVLASTYGRARMGAEVTRLAEQVRADDKEFAKEGKPEETVLTRKVIWSLIDAFCRCQEIKHMQSWIRELKKRPVAADDSTTPGDEAPKKEGDGEKGMDLGDSPCAELSQKDQLTMINYFCRAGLLDDAELIIKAADESKTDVPFAALNSMARGYARAQRFDKCVETLHKMRDRNYVPDASTALNLSTMFVKAGLHEQAQQVIAWRRQYAKTHVDEAEENIV